MQLTNKTIVVTGAGSGIGQQLSMQLAQRGANVAGVDINATALGETGNLAGPAPGQFKGFRTDITDPEKVNALPAEVLAHFGSVDGIINNAGIIQPFRPVPELTMEEINRVMAVNFYGTIYVTRAFVPLLLTRPEAHIVNVSSMGGFLPVPGQTIYGAAKAAVKLFTEGLYAELKDTPVKVTVVFPGAIATNIMQNSGLNLPKADTAGESKFKPIAAAQAASEILRGMEKNQFRVVIGPDARAMDKLYRLSPRYAADLIQRKMRSLLG
ncbi:short-subunit dehydrogenase [Dyadobacter sp. BE34]|uniref:Short-subunit dehydrogenase n=1 Tax=Dyadobacter fermentans TaxID=94254 RepID=A0ABU1QU71_9BACT|nr:MULTISPECIES: SDR family oxidoreductase [Dyadobacter]MDR6804709.1 short-subunit dehydrogenase [Dyadobacter fermentans]MDR7043532.1 short-subunit dehydrogenase [Dyadobacter sp. BE242]MDR7197844.1 short-subunit dehydrogenase [Dyadobacter sp. BE34]MDR7214723.1 short-subunit dehydrogenase [Dyadobacter sp. BE31]MDR7262258.1 short-subunit dehydrogenase [Dyadobacter sp. BE32]